jgi:hypothetical protein
MEIVFHSSTPVRKSSGKKQGSVRSKLRKADVSLGSDLAAAGRLANRALAVFKGASSLLLNAEFKHIDATVAAAVSTTPSITALCVLAQGDTNITRDGNSIKCTGFDFRFFWSINASATNSLARLVIFIDTRNVGAAPTATDVFASSTIALPNVDSQPNRFVILFDSTVSLVLAASSRQFVSSAMSLAALRGVHFTFNGNAGTVADLRGACLFAYVLSNEATNTPSVDLQCRTWFVDN